MALSPLFSLPWGRALALIAALSCAWSGPASAAETAPAACPPLLQKSFKRLQDDAPQNLCQYAGKVLLVVNTASYCGFTPQYEGLEKLYAQYGSKGLVVLGFPSNDFGDQEPGKGKDIADFCYNTYGVKFPMFEKTVVSGKSANPLFAELSKAGGGQQHRAVDLLADSSGLVKDVQKALAQP